jgi:vancomycin resistance protein YoaR
MVRGWLKDGGAAIRLPLLLTGLSLLGLSVGTLLWLMSHQAPLPEGFRLMGLSLKGVPPSQLTDWLAHLDTTLSEIPVRVEQTPHSTSRLRDWGVRLDIPRTREAILQAWHEAPFWQRLLGRAKAAIEPHWQIEPSRFRQQLQLFRSLERVPQDARLRYQQSAIAIVPEQPGRRLSEDGCRANLLDALATLHQGNCPPSTADHRGVPTELRLNLAFEPIPPRITAEQLQLIDGELASYTTRFPGYQVNRNHNIRLAANALNGRVLLPGERLSFNEAVGKRTLKQGFRIAPVIIRGQKRLGVGGGICQVSSTLFNAALLADLAIVRRHNHSIPVPYVPLGRDATVSDTGLDLVIENDSPFPVAIVTELGRSHLTVRVLGKVVSGRRVVLQTHRLRSGGRRVALWRLVYEAGRLVRREHIATSTYRPPQPTSWQTASQRLSTRSAFQATPSMP